MKITKQKLKKIILEETQNILQERDWLSWVPDFIQKPWGGGESRQTLHHGIDWYKQQSDREQRRMLDNFRSQGGAIDARGVNKPQFNDWLWKWYVPKGVKSPGLYENQDWLPATEDRWDVLDQIPGIGPVHAEPTQLDIPELQLRNPDYDRPWDAEDEALLDLLVPPLGDGPWSPEYRENYELEREIMKGRVNPGYMLGTPVG